MLDQITTLIFVRSAGQALDFSGTEWKEDRQIGFVEPEAV